MDTSLDHKAHLQRAVDAFANRFGREPRFAATAPGRVNLIGEHTDYNDGLVLPMAIERRTIVVAGHADAQRITVATGLFDQALTFNLDEPIQPGEPKWGNYVKGVVAGCKSQELVAGGFDAWIDSTVPLGGGLSSSASLEVAVATLIEQMAERSLDPIDKALLCQHAEHQFAGMPCGIMDQFIATMGLADHALLIDCRSHQVRQVAMSDPEIAVLIINSHVKHELAASAYPKRRAQCEQAAKSLGVKTLRDVTMKQLVAAKGQLDQVVYQRAYHVIGENARTLQAADEIEAGAWWSVGRLMLKSHVALRDHFQVSCAELDLLVELAQQRINEQGGVYGSRMTGGGFGGCTVSLVRANMVQEIAHDICTQYQQRTGITATAFASRAAGGACVLEV